MKKNGVLVCVTGQLSCERLIVTGAEMAVRRKAPLYVLHVARTKDHVLGYVNEPEALEYLLRASVSHGAEMLVVRNDDVLSAIEAQVREKNIGTLVAGRSGSYSGWDMLDTLKLRIPDVDFEIQ